MLGEDKGQGRGGRDDTKTMTLAINSILMNQQYILSKVLLKRNIYEIRLCTDQLMKTL